MPLSAAGEHATLPASASCGDEHRSVPSSTISAWARRIRPGFRQHVLERRVSVFCICSPISVSRRSSRDVLPAIGRAHEFLSSSSISATVHRGPVRRRCSFLCRVHSSFPGAAAIGLQNPSDRRPVKPGRSRDSRDTAPEPGLRSSGLAICETNLRILAESLWPISGAWPD